jgi:hypothetical protein
MLEQITSEPNLRLIMMGIAVLFAVMGFARGIGRLILLAAALAAGGAAALAWLRYMPGVKLPWWEKNPEEFIKWGALGAGLLVALIIQRLLRAVFSGGEPGAMDRGTRVRGGLLGFIPAVVLLWGGAVAVRWAGAASQLRHVEQAVKAQDMEPLENGDLMSRLSRSMDRGILGDILNRTDPMDSRETEAAATLLVLQANKDVENRAWRHSLVGPLMHQPSFQRLKGDKDVTRALSFSEYSRLLALPEMATALKDRVLREAVLHLDMEAVLKEIITGHTPGGAPRATIVPE